MTDDSQDPHAQPAPLRRWQPHDDDTCAEDHKLAGLLGRTPRTRACTRPRVPDQIMRHTQ
jgi:hypothetical protein